MPISLSCDCGHSLRVKDELAGKRIRCPTCKSALSVPSGDDDDFLNDLPVPPVRKKKPRTDEDEELAELPPALPAPKKKKKADTEDEADESSNSRAGGFGSASAGIGGGILMIIIAIVWFVVGLYAGYIYFYPPVLLVLGIVSIGKGMMNND